MIVAYRGRRGSGKTASMVRDAYISYTKGRKIYSNIHLYFPYEPITHENISKLKDSEFDNCVLLIDEIQVIFNSRNFQSKRNKDFSIFVQQTRKRKVDLFFTTQSLRTVDVNIRENIDINVFPKPIYDDNENLIGFESIYQDPYGREGFGIYKDLSIVSYLAKPIFKLYDTNQIVTIK